MTKDRRAPVPEMPKLIERSIGDDNFAHCLSLIPFTTSWAESIDRKYRPTDPHEVGNMIYIPCEVLWAFIKDYGEKDAGPLGKACRAAIAQLASNRTLFSREARVSAQQASEAA